MVVNDKVEINTGAAVSVVSKMTYHQTRQKQALVIQPMKVRLHTYTGEKVMTLSCMQVDIVHGTEKVKVLACLDETG